MRLNLKNMIEILQFLVDLSLNNQKTWFEENKSRYESSKKTLEQFISKLIFQISIFDDSIASVKPKSAIFRIYRDTRFSKDKTPYKKNMGAYITNGGKMLGLA